MLMHSLVSVIMVWVSRQVIQRRAANQRPQRAREYLNGFIQLVEETYRQHVRSRTWPIGWGFPCPTSTARAVNWRGNRRCRSCTSVSCWRPSAC